MRRLVLMSFVALAVFASACGSDAASPGAVATVATARPAPTPPGQSVEIDLPDFDAEAVLIGLSVGQGLQVRAQPGATQPVVGEIPAGSSGLNLLDEAFETPDGVTWWLINWNNIQGWVQPQIAFAGLAADVTSQAQAALGAETEFASASELALAVGQAIADPLGAPEVVEVATTQVAGQQSAAVTVDLVGLEDDSIAGYRLIVTADGSQSNGTTWKLATVVQQPLCPRGVTPQGLCV